MIFIDSSYFIALLDSKEKHHERAVSLYPEILDDNLKFVPLLMLSELMAHLGRYQGGQIAKTAYEIIKDNFNIYYPSSDDIDNAMELVLHYGGSLSLADCLAIVLMRDMNSYTIYSFDSDFDKEGIVRVH